MDTSIRLVKFNKQLVVNAKFLSQPITGVQRFASELSKKLRDFDEKIIFVSPKNIIHNDLAQELDARPVGKKTGVLWEQYELPKYLKSLDKPLLINLANAAPINYQNQIVTIHDLGFKIKPEWYSKLFSYYYNFLIPRIAKNSKLILTVSNCSKTDLIQYLKVPEYKVKVIYNSVSEDFKLPLNKKAVEPYILAVSSLDPRKNFNNLIQAFNLVKSLNFKLIIVGAENKIFTKPEFKRLIQNNKNIVLTGYISDAKLIDLYQNATAFIYPSFYEGFGIPPLEAMACGCPTIVSKVSSMPEIFKDACHYVDPYCIEDIARGIELVLNNDMYRTELCRRGLEIVEKYSWADSAKKLVQVINSINN